MQLLTNLRKQRTARGITQQYMACRLNISQRAYSKLECGQMRLSVKRLYEIAALLAVPVGELMETEKHDLTPDD